MDTSTLCLLVGIFDIITVLSELPPQNKDPPCMIYTFGIRSEFISYSSHRHRT